MARARDVAAWQRVRALAEVQYGSMTGKPLDPRLCNPYRRVKPLPAVGSEGNKRAMGNLMDLFMREERHGGGRRQRQ